MHSSEMTAGKRQPSPLLVFIYVCVLFREFQNVVSWWSEMCSGCIPNSFFTFIYCSLMNLTESEPKTGLKRNVVVCIVVAVVVAVFCYRCGGGGSSLLQRKRNIFNKRCCCFVCVLFCCCYCILIDVAVLLTFAVGKFLFKFRV